MSAMDTDIAGDQEMDVPRKQRRPGKVLVLYIILPVLVLIGAGIGLYMSGIFAGGEKEKVVEVTPPVFYDLPDFLVNLSGPPPQHYLKLRVSLEVVNKDAVASLETVMPRVLDGFQTFLRELRPEDLEGSQGMLTLREELMRRISLATQQQLVSDVLFREIIVQ